MFKDFFSALLRFLRRGAGRLLRLEFGLFFRETAAAARRVLLSLRAAAGGRRLRRDLGRRVSGRRVIVFPPTLDWNAPLYQRPQQLARAYSETEGTLVVYLTANAGRDRVAVYERLSDTLWLVNAALVRELARIIRGAGESIVSLSWTANLGYVSLLRPDRLIYEYIDELEIFDGFGEQMRRDHEHLLREADLTVCTAQRLYEAALPRARKAILSPNAGDYALFSRTSEAKPDARIAAAAAGKRYTLGYYGALAEWFDYELIKRAAQSEPDWLFALVGMDYDGSLRRSGVCGLENVLWLPPVPYARLPSCLRSFDIALIPFVLNGVTLSTSPVKLFEYMAAEKPILAPRMPECLKYACVATYSGPEDFIAKAKELLSRKDEPELKAALRRDALDNTWARRCGEILRALET